jgi:hypothetical protein
MEINKVYTYAEDPIITVLIRFTKADIEAMKHFLKSQHLKWSTHMNIETAVELIDAIIVTTRP